LVITLFFKIENTNFYGIAETREIEVNLENPVEIERIHVVEGQSIEKGQLLVDLNNPELMLKINQVSHQLAQIKAQKGFNHEELKSKIGNISKSMW